MGLPRIFGSKPAADKYYLTVLLTDHAVSASLWRVAQGGVDIVSQSSAHSYVDAKSAVVATDSGLQELGKQSENVNEVVFGFESEWVGPKGLQDVKKPLVKQITDQLSLNSVGFIVLSEALAHSLSEQPQWSSTLVLYVTERTLTITLINRSKVMATKSAGRSADLGADTTEVLARLQTEPHVQATQLPTKVVLASVDIPDAQLSEHQQELVNRQWETNIFLHQPTVEIFPQEKAIESIVKQAGGAVAKTTPAAVVATHSDNLQSSAATNDLGFQPFTSASSFGIPMTAKPMPHPADSHDSFSTAPPLHFGTMGKPANSWVKSHKPFVFMGVVSGLVALLGIGYGWLVMTSQAVIDVQLQTKPVSAEVDITLDSQSSQSDIDQRILAARTQTKTVEGSAEIPTTGVKLVGEKAKGTISLLNKTSSTKTFTAGTKFTSGKLLFTLEGEVSVASASVSQQGSEGETKTYGKADATVIASVIGADSNLGTNTELKVGDFASETYSAVVKTAFTGGSSREVRVVSDKDRINLLNQLKGELIKKAEAELTDIAADGEYVIPTGQTTVKTSKYSAEIGQEVSDLKLDLELEAVAVTYQAADLKPIAIAALSSQVPTGYTLSDGEPQILSAPDGDKSASQSGHIQLTAQISATALPQIDVENWKREIVGRSLTQAHQQLSGKSEVKSVTVQLEPKWGEKIRKMVPKKSERITINITE